MHEVTRESLSKTKTLNTKITKTHQRILQDFLRQVSNDNGRDSETLECAAFDCIVNDKYAMRLVKSLAEVIWLGCKTCEEWYHVPCIGLKDKPMEETEIGEYICKNHQS